MSQFFPKIFAVAVVVLVGCAEALPQRDPEAVIQHTARQVDTLSARSKQYALEVKQERMKSEALLEEARRILAQVQESESLCRSALTEARRPRKPKVVYIRETPKAPASQPTAEVSPTPTAPTAPVEEIEYAPSDAPVGKAPRAAESSQTPRVTTTSPGHEHR